MLETPRYTRLVTAPDGMAAVLPVPPDRDAALAGQPLVDPRGNTVNVVHLAAELAPFARSGGLGEAVSSLATFQAASGVPTSIVMPFYGPVRNGNWPMVPATEPFSVQVGPRQATVRLWEYAPETVQSADGNFDGTLADALVEAPLRPRIYFVESADYFDRPGLYGPPGTDYPDNAQRYACFVLAALSALPRITSGPTILHAHDWHTALAPVYLRTYFAQLPVYAHVSTVLSVHNAGYQGQYAPSTMPEVGLPWELYNWRQLEWHNSVNLLKGGIAFADIVTTVSSTHAHELRTGAGGFGLDGAFIALRDRLVGIPNGIDQQVWNPTSDPLIARNYSADDLSAKRRCRVALQRAVGLRKFNDLPIFAMTARLVAQKGLDLILGDPGYFALDAQFVFLGRGEPRYEAALTEIAKRAPARISVQLRFTEELEHRLLAGADMCLMPSQYEPCGLTQMRAQRYGTIPIARRVGGLADTIEDGVTGFLFDDYTPDDFMRAAVRAVDQFQDAEGWQGMMREAMARDFGWERSAARYLAVYRRVVQSSSR